MIVLDTHIWLWWVHGDPLLPQNYRSYIQQHVSQGLGISIFSCWEVAKLVERGRISLPFPVEDWLHLALTEPGIRLLQLTPRIIVESTQLPGTFHRDPADQLIVGTARVYACPLMTMDTQIRNYPHVQLAL